MARPTEKIAIPSIPRRAILKGLAMAPVLFRPAPFFGAASFSGAFASAGPEEALLFSRTRFVSHYPARSPLTAILQLVAPGSDEYASEKYAAEIETIFKRWAKGLEETPHLISALSPSLDLSIQASSLSPFDEKTLRSAYGMEVVRRQFKAELAPGRDRCLRALFAWLEHVERIHTAEFEIYAINEVSKSPLAVRVDLRYDLVTTR